PARLSSGTEVPRRLKPAPHCAAKRSTSLGAPPGGDRDGLSPAELHLELHRSVFDSTLVPHRDLVAVSLANQLERDLVANDRSVLNLRRAAIARYGSRQPLAIHLQIQEHLAPESVFRSVAEL